MPKQRIADQIAAALPLIQRIRVTAQQVQQDAATTIEALELALALLPGTTFASGRPVNPLDTAITRSGRTVAEVGFLAGLSEQRVRAIAAGDRANVTEREALMRVLPDWNGGTR